MGKVENKDGGASYSIYQRGVCDNVLGKVDSWQILDVFVILIDKGGELLRAITKFWRVMSG